jgi:hypothetical protein
MKSRFFVILIAIALAGCNLNAETTIYVADALEVSETGQALETPVDLSIEVSSEKTCKKDGPAIAEALGSTFTGCTKKGFDDYVSTRKMISVSAQETNDMLALTTLQTEQGVRISIPLQ